MSRSPSIHIIHLSAEYLQVLSAVFPIIILMIVLRYVERCFPHHHHYHLDDRSHVRRYILLVLTADRINRFVIYLT